MSARAAKRPGRRFVEPSGAKSAESAKSTKATGGPQNCLEPDKTAPRFAALFALNMLVGTRGGSSYSEPEYAGWLGEAGFREIRHVRRPGMIGLMIGWRP